MRAPPPSSSHIHAHTHTIIATRSCCVTRLFTALSVSIYICVGVFFSFYACLASLARCLCPPRSFMHGFALSPRDPLLRPETNDTDKINEKAREKKTDAKGCISTSEGTNVNGKHFFVSNKQDSMSLSLSEGLKRRREEHQLAMQLQCDDQPCHRCSRTDAWSFEISGCPPYAVDHGGRADTERVQRDDYVRVPSSPSSSSIRGIHESSITTSTDCHLCPYAASAHRLSATAALSSAKLSPSCRLSWRAHNDSKMTLTLRSIRVSVVRGDSGRRCSFLIQPTFAYTWHRRSTYNGSVDGAQAGIELQETVRCRVSSSIVTQSNSATVGPATATNKIASSTSGSATTPGAATTVSLFEGYPGHLCHNEEASSSALRSDVPGDVFGDGYTYEATQISRCRSIPMSLAGLEESASSLGSCSPALFVDCLIKCAQDEAAVALDDRHGWVHLYRGRHIATEVGRTRLLTDVLALGYFGAASASPIPSCSEPPSLTICVFRKC
ncbi:hypothetical protein conserved [Leishmania donovani]|nr:hypothetical protein conserved [Leishmania donovani]